MIGHPCGQLVTARCSGTGVLRHPAPANSTRVMGHSRGTRPSADHRPSGRPTSRPRVSGPGLRPPTPRPGPGRVSGQRPGRAPGDRRRAGRPVRALPELGQRPHHRSRPRHHQPPTSRRTGQPWQTRGEKSSQGSRAGSVSVRPRRLLTRVGSRRRPVFPPPTTSSPGPGAPPSTIAAPGHAQDDPLPAPAHRRPHHPNRSPTSLDATWPWADKLLDAIERARTRLRPLTVPLRPPSTPAYEQPWLVLTLVG